MITLRRGQERGHANHGWLDTYHTFSFADYHDPRHMGFRSLRVINEDRIEPGQGFGTHSHRDMEILTYVISGTLEHRDSLGSGGLIRPGELQRMSAGTGISHSEFNHSQSEPVHLLQIWILPERRGIAPGYEQRVFPLDSRRGELKLLASAAGTDGSLTVHQDARVYGTILEGGQSAAHPLGAGRGAWVQVARGAVAVNGEQLAGGDGAALADVREVRLDAQEEAELLLFDLA